MQKYIPVILIGGIVLFILYRLTSTKGATQIINRAIPTATTTSIVDTRDPYRAQAFGQLASLAATISGQETSLALAEKQITAESNRLQSAKDLESQRLQNQLQISQLGFAGMEKGFANQLASDAQKIQGALDLARINADTRKYDINAQLQAQERMGDAATRSQVASGLGNLLSQILGALNKRQSSGGGSGGSSGSARTPNTFPNRNQGSGRPDTGCSVFGIPIPCEPYLPIQPNIGGDYFPYEYPDVDYTPYDWFGGIRYDDQSYLYNDNYSGGSGDLTAVYGDDNEYWFGNDFVDSPFSFGGYWGNDFYNYVDGFYESGGGDYFDYYA